jgi:hypothetical protein
MRCAFTKALESYRQAIALLKLLRESPERELRELELAQSIILPLVYTAGDLLRLKLSGQSSMPQCLPRKAVASSNWST